MTYSLIISQQDVNGGCTSILANEPVFVYADSVRIYQIVSNLLNNAVKFTPMKTDVRKSITIAIDTKYTERKIGSEKEEAAGEVIVSVKDVGRGIDQKIRPRLFSKFVTTSDGLKLTYSLLYLCGQPYCIS
jgi:signal transduction histidine kinase